MTIKTIQTCDKCKRERAVAQQLINTRNQGGWRVFEEKDLCPDCVKSLVESISR